MTVRDVDALLAEAERADVTGWDFGWLDGRATEERPPWGYTGLLAARLTGVASALDLDTGGGEVLAGVPHLPPRMCATESWAPNAARARELLAPRGVEVVPVAAGEPLPFPDGAFELVTSRHPLAPDWPEIRRVLAPGGRYLAQHVGPASVVELREHFLGAPARGPDQRDPRLESAAAGRAGLTVTHLRTARCRIEILDVGAVVYLLRKCPWWVPDFTVDRYRARLRSMDALIRRDGCFVTHSTRHLLEAAR